MYAHNFRLYFTPLSAVLLTFPSRYLYTIDRKTYLVLEGGPPSFRQGFTCPVLLDNRNKLNHKDSHYPWALRPVIIRFPTLGIPGFHSLWPTFPDRSARLGNFLPYADLGRACCQYGKLDSSRAPHWLITCHNPLYIFAYQLIHLSK